MSIKNEFKELNIVFNKLTPKAFAKELEIGQHPILKDNEQFVKFLQLYSLEFDKDKALLFAEYFLSISDDQNRDSREVIYLRIQSFVFSLKRDIEKCKKVLKNIEKNQNKFTKKIVSEVRLNLAMTARAIGDFGLAYEMYHNNIAFWGEDNSQLAIRALARTYTNLSVLYYYVTDKSRGRYFFDKAEEYIPKIDDKTIYYQYFTQSIYFKFDNNVISAEEALKLMDTIEASSVTNSISYKIYLIQYLFASKKIDKTLEITTELIENEGNLADNLLAQIVYYNLKCLYIKKEEKLFVKIFDTYYNLLSSSESLLTDFLDLFDKKITILEKAENYLGLIDLYKNYLKQQKIIFEKYSKLDMDNSEAKLILREKELELDHLKEVFATKEEINKLLIEKNRSLENFASMTAHDIKAPIGKISLFISMLESTLDLTPDDKIMFDFISSSSKRLSILIDDLLTFANSGTFSKSTNIKIELKTIINTVIDNLNTIISSKNARIETIGDFPIIKINPTAITVLLQNFINNSIKFTHSDIKPVIKISSEILNNKFLIYITDNGLGIPKEDIEKIFTPFGRSLRSKEIDGSGLGLATCLKIVKSYNGEIKVEDNSKTGSTFTIIFPLDLLDEEISLKP